MTPELTLSVETLPGLTVYGFASRRFEQRVPGAPRLRESSASTPPTSSAPPGRSTGPERASRATPTGRLELEASRREISEAFQLLLDTDVIDRVDALYLFPGDVADEVSGSFTIAVKADVAARLALLGGRVHGDGMTAGGTLPNDARYWVSSARVDVRPSGTSVAVRYRLLEQELGSRRRSPTGTTASRST